MDNLSAISESWAKDIIKTAKATQSVQTVLENDQVLVVTHSEDQAVHSIDLEKYNRAPTRTKETLTVAETKSFVDYWQTFATDSSVIMARLDQRRFTAVFDYPQPGKPAWKEHQCALTCQLSTEWQTWYASNEATFSQISFAEFIESNAIDIVEPTAATMLEVAMTLEANKKVKFNSGVRLDNGQIQLGYHEVIEGSAGTKGDLQIPDKFKLAIRVFQGGEKYSVDCNLRYRINDGDLKFFFQIVRPERLLEDAFEQVKKQIETSCQGATIYAVT